MKLQEDASAQIRALGLDSEVKDRAITAVQKAQSPERIEHLLRGAKNIAESQQPHVVTSATASST